MSEEKNQPIDPIKKCEEMYPEIDKTIVRVYET